MDGIESGTLFDQNGEQRRRLYKRVGAVVGAAALVAAGIGIGIGIDRWASGPHNLATGVVSCEDNQRVEGVLVDGRGWANITPRGNITGTVSYSLKIPASSYEVTVGCDGKIHSWAISDLATSRAVVDSPVGFKCEAAPSDTPSKLQGTCEQGTLAVP